MFLELRAFYRSNKEKIEDYLHTKLGNEDLKHTLILFLFSSFRLKDKRAVVSSNPTDP